MIIPLKNENNMKKKFDFNFSPKQNVASDKVEKKVSRKDFRRKAAPYENEESAPVTTIYIGNLNYKRDEESIKELFAPFGYVKSVKIVYKDGSELKSGIAFVQMTNEEKALKAISELNGKLVDDRTLKVSVANNRFNK
jgi:RNA recognition motif-containing protein